MIGEFLKELEQKEIEISFSEGILTYSGPEENITPELIGKLKENKTDLIKYFWPHECKNMISVNSEGSKTPLIFIECLNLSCLISNYFGSDQPIYEFHNNTWSTGERYLHKNMESLAKDYINQLKKIIPKGPYILGGHSFGGTLAYEMAIQLEKTGNEVPLLILFDTMSPFEYKSINRQNKTLNISIILLKILVKKLLKHIQMSVYCSIFLFRKSLPKASWRNYILTNYYILTHKYRPNKLNVNLMLFKASIESSKYKHDYGWGSLGTKVKTIEIEGDHISIIKEAKNVVIMGKEIENFLTISGK